MWYKSVRAACDLDGRGPGLGLLYIHVSVFLLVHQHQLVQQFVLHFDLMAQASEAGPIGDAAGQGVLRSHSLPLWFDYMCADSRAADHGREAKVSSGARW